MSRPLTLEVCVDSVDSAIAAERGGADRIELCSALTEGGITPSSGVIAAVREKVHLALHVMIRPRGADFCYSDDEFRIMREDILGAKRLGADGVVFGILKPDGNVDVDRTRQLSKLAAPMRVTFHRAFDMSADLFASLRDLQAIGVHCILTSGGKQTAVEGAETLKRLIAAAAGSIAIMAGSGIEEHNVGALLEETKVREIHASLRGPAASPMRFRNENIAMGAEKGLEYRRFVVHAQTVERLLRAARNGKA